MGQTPPTRKLKSTTAQELATGQAPPTRKHHLTMAQELAMNHLPSLRPESDDLFTTKKPNGL